MTPAEYIQGILRQDPSVLARGITLVESTLATHQEQAREIVAACASQKRESLRIAVTGSPGVGKSTFIEAIGSYLADQGKKLAVLAIDASSERSGGSILGDKTRMVELAANPNAFIRPSPGGSGFGGVARRTFEAILLCEAAGYEIILVETLGIGQCETAVCSMVDLVVLLMLPNAGDELQIVKRGITQLADLIVVTKADGENHQAAELAKARCAWALSLIPPRVPGWAPTVEVCSAIARENLERIWQLIAGRSETMRANGFLAKNRESQFHAWLGGKPGM